MAPLLKNGHGIDDRGAGLSLTRSSRHVPHHTVDCCGIRHYFSSRIEARSSSPAVNSAVDSQLRVLENGPLVR
jgi:hypothetical protein